MRGGQGGVVGGSRSGKESAGEWEGGDGEGAGELAGKIRGREGVKVKERENRNFERDKGIRRGCKARGVN